MDNNIIYKECNYFRTVISKIPRSKFSENIQLGISKFPDGCCSDVSELLATYLIKKNITPCYYISGESGGRNKEILTHAWLSYNSIIIDITADQFNRKGYNLPNVYVGKQTKFHNTFNIVTKREGGIYHWKNIDSIIFNNLNKAYLTIMNEINHSI